MHLILKVCQCWMRTTLLKLVTDGPAVRPGLRACWDRVMTGSSRFQGPQAHLCLPPPGLLKICTKCNWHCVQDDVHVFINCPTWNADLTELRMKYHVYHEVPRVP